MLRKNLLSPLRMRLILLTLVALFSPASGLLAAINHIDSPADLAPLTVQGYSNATVNYAAGTGTGTPATGGILMFDAAPNGVNEHTAIVYANASLNAASNGVFETSLMVNFKDFYHTDGVKDKGDIRIGFTTATTINASKPQEFLNKTSPCLSVRLTAEHQHGSADRKLETEVVSFTTIEEKPAALKKAVSSASYFQNWLRLTLTATKTGASTFSITVKVEDCGGDGTDAPIVIAALSAGPSTVTNATFASDTSIFPAFLIKPDKISGTTTYVDNYTYEATLPAPAEPVAVTAGNITSSGFTAQWDPGAGVLPTSYIVEMSTAANQFAPGTLIAANGNGGQVTGVTTTSTSQAFLNLSPVSSYVYRVRAGNATGQSGYSNTIPVNTIAGNSAPTLDPIPAAAPIRPTDGTRQIALTGISSGGEVGQTITITAISSNPTILPHPSIVYTSPATTGTLSFTPSGAGSGSVTITVTVNDGQAQNNTISQVFTVLVQQPPSSLGFEDNAGLVNVLAETMSATAIRTDATGTGTPASGGLVIQGTGGNVEKGVVAWRAQSYSGVTSTDLHASMFYSPREVDDLTSKDKGELSIGFVGSLQINTSKPQEFLRKTNPGISVKLNAEHDLSEAAKVRVLEVESVSFDGFIEAKGPKFTVLNTPAINHWLKLVLDAVKVSANSYSISYRLEDWGVDGSAFVGVLIAGTPFTATNATIAADTEIWSAFSFAPEKNGVAKHYLDQWETIVGENPPAAPVAQNAVQVTSDSFLARWERGAGVYATGYVLQVTTAANAFAANTFINADGVGGQAGGIVIASGTELQQRILNLPANTAYVYRVRGTNAYGASAQSNTVSVTTLVSGANSTPTLDPIANPGELNINSSQQTVLLSGISAGGEQDQFASIVATSSNPALIPDPFVDHFDPSETGTLFFTPIEGQTGTAVITVTVDDGQATNHFITRTFTITIAEPQTLIGFNDATALTRLSITDALGAQFAFGATAGIAGGGGAVFSRSGALESTTVAFRQTAYDATVSPWMSGSLFINIREAMAITTGKDKVELRLGFTGENTPNATNPKDSLNKTHPAIGLVLKAEHQVGASDKNRKVEIEMFSYNGITESKSAKSGGSNVTATANWLQVNFYAVRGGQNQYFLVFDVQNWGVDGTTWQGQLFTGGPFAVTNAPFATDTSVYSGFSVSPEKTSVANLFFDSYETIVNTTAPDAPLALAASDVRAREFTAEWAPALIGLPAEAYVLDISTQANDFAAGTLINASGVGGQSSGIQINDPFTTSRRITGLSPSTHYIYRIRAKRGSELSAIVGRTFVTTLATDFVHWRETHFAGLLGNPAISGPDADPDGDGLSNLYEYAFGMEPRNPGAAGLPVVSESNGYLSITFFRRVNAPDVLYLPQSSGDLSEAEGGFTSNVTEVFASSPDSEGLQTVTVEDNIPMDEALARFMRLRVLSIP